MHLHFEEPSSRDSRGRQRLRCDSVITSLSWMGRVPDEQPEGHGWKLNRTSYYQEGWLAAGNLKSVVGVSFTTTLLSRGAGTETAPVTATTAGSGTGAGAGTGEGWIAGGATVGAGNSSSSSPLQLPLPPRTNYNLRGHRAQICLVRWNEPYQKLATCDASGIIFVWIRYEGRWSIELINDRNTPVTHFSWSHDGRMAVIAYQDGFVLVGSVAGQRYWSTILSQDLIITTGTWTPDDQQVYLGTSNGVIVILDVHNGAIVAQIQMNGPLLSSPSSSGMTSTTARDFNNSTSSTAVHPQPNNPTAAIPSGRNQQPGSTSLPNSSANGIQNNNHQGIRQLAWNCPRFKMEEPSPMTQPAALHQQMNNGIHHPSFPHHPLAGLIEDQQYVLAVLTTNGRLSLVRSFEGFQQHQQQQNHQQPPPPPSPQPTESWEAASGGPNGCSSSQQQQLLCGSMMEWSNDGELLCLAGHYVADVQNPTNGGASSSSSPPSVQPQQQHYVNVLQFFSSSGVLRFRATVPYSQSPITSLTWGHNDRRLFIATGCQIHVAWVSPRRMASLQHLARLRLRLCLSEAEQLDTIGMPRLLRDVVMAPLFSSTIHCPVPSEARMREYVCRPPPGHTRLYCTIIRRSSSSPSDDGLGFYDGMRTNGLGGNHHHHHRSTSCHHPDPDGDGSSSDDDEIDGLMDSTPVPPLRFRGSSASQHLRESGVGFTLYLEFLGGLIPLLKGKPTSRLRPEFIIYDPYAEEKHQLNLTAERNQLLGKSNGNKQADPSTSVAGTAAGTTGSRLVQLLSPAMQRKFRRNNNNLKVERDRHQQTSEAKEEQLSDSETDESCVSTPRLHRRKFGRAARATPHQEPPSAPTIPPSNTNNENPTISSAPSPLLAQVTSNIWGTKFKITGLSSDLPSHLGQVTYKTSLLHLQPRQMTLGVVDLRDTPEEDDGDDDELNFQENPSQISVPPVPTDDEHHRRQEEEEGEEDEESAALLGSASASSVAPTRTPNLRLLRRRQPPPTAGPSRRLPEPPPAPTHHRRPSSSLSGRRMMNHSALIDESSIRVEWDSNSSETLGEDGQPVPAERIVVLASPVQKKVTPSSPTNSNPQKQRRSLSADGRLCSDVRHVPIIAGKRKSKSRSLDSSPSASSRINALTGRSWIVKEKPAASRSDIQGIFQDNPSIPSINNSGSSFRSTRIGTQPEVQPVNNGTRQKLPQAHPQQQRGLVAAGLARLSPLFGRKFNSNSQNKTDRSEPNTPASSPASSRRQKKQQPSSERHSSPIRQLLNSPFLARRLGRHCPPTPSAPAIAIEESDSDEDLLSGIGNKVRGGVGGTPPSSHRRTTDDYRNLESFQKAQLLNKLRQTLTEETSNSNGTVKDVNKQGNGTNDQESSEESQARQRREFVLTNKAPLWNEHSQVYQLDFGGRVTQESAKNFQIEFKGKQVMQFGRIDGNAYTLDFQYPFSAVQAFAVALANVTQRLK